ncbi:MAG TPA: hypothetical protein PLQ27_02585 [Candidatus Paceibacterota bacterium]|nr:hypothetical protein [Candidatus Paceibacterota bacterium]
MSRQTFKNQKGVASLIVVISLSTIVFMISFSMTIISFWQLMKAKDNFDSLSAYYSAYSGIEDALLKLERNINLNGSYNLSVINPDDVTVNVLNTGSSAQIVSTSSYGNNYRKLKVSASIDSETGLVTILSITEEVY